MQNSKNSLSILQNYTKNSFIDQVEDRGRTSFYAIPTKYAKKYGSGSNASS